ncbi:MAG: NUDIX domain-containing protein [Candidatus Paceibacterota bacterium]|jgi:8-oxo-dGTP pyrophosphatase MutT (NUDIX family)
MENTKLHEIVITAIVVKPSRPDDGLGGEGKFLITRRSAAKKRFPLMWTVPGGRLETADYINLPKDTKEYWYNVLEKTVRREVKEETGLDISDVEYVTSLATVHADGTPSLVISCMAKYAGGDIVFQEGESVEAAWVNLEEARGYDLIDGIYDELAMANERLLGKKSEWKRAN